MFKKKLGFLLGIMLLLSVAGYVICLTAGSKQIKGEDEFLLVTSFYPMYILAENLTEGVEGITVANLTENQTGCLHDYQLTSGDMKLLSEADAFLINGAGMELFLDKVMEQRAELPVIEASHGISLLEGVAHSHNHEEEDAVDGHEHVEEPVKEDHDHEEEEEHEEEHAHAHAENGHVWMDVTCYKKQLNTVAAELAVLLPEQEEAIMEAKSVYEHKLEHLAGECESLETEIGNVPVVIFHEAFAYLAESLGMEVLMALSLDEETVPSAGEIAEVIEEINYHGTALIFIEEQYASHAEKITAETGAMVVYLNPLTTGDGAVDSYISGMHANLEAIRETLEWRLR